MRNGVVRSLAVAAATVGLALTASPVPANAAETSAVQACVITPGAPFKSGSYVKANYRSSGCSSNWDITFMLQRHRAWGWENLAVAYYFGDGSGSLQSYCAGEGTYTYRTLVDSPGWIDVSNSVRFTC